MGCGFSKPVGRSASDFDVSGEAKYRSTKPHSAGGDNEDMLSIGRPGTPEGRIVEEPSAISLRIRMTYAQFMAQMSDRQHTAEEEAQPHEAAATTPRKELPITPRRAAAAAAAAGQSPSVLGSATVSSIRSPMPHRGNTHVPPSEHGAGSIVTQSSSSTLLHHELSVISRKLDLMNQWVDGTLPFQPLVAGIYLETELAEPEVKIPAETVVVLDPQSPLIRVVADQEQHPAEEDTDDEDVFAESFHGTLQTKKASPGVGGGVATGGAATYNHLNARNLYRHVNMLVTKLQQQVPPGTTMTGANSVATAAFALMANSGLPVSSVQQKVLRNSQQEDLLGTHG